MNKELKQDLELAQSVLANTQSLSEKYHVKEIPDLIRILTVAVECSIPVEELFVSGLYAYLSCKDGFFTFKVTQNPSLQNKTTFSSDKPAKWYIIVSCGGMGISNICVDRKLAREPEVQQTWEKFLKWIKSYNPIDTEFTHTQYKYIFSVEDGYKLYQDFHEKYQDVWRQVDRIIKTYELEEFLKDSVLREYCSTPSPEKDQRMIGLAPTKEE